MSFHPVTAEEMQDRIAKLEVDIERLSRCDQLTGFLNRVAFLAEVDDHLGRPQAAVRGGALVEISVRGIGRFMGCFFRSRHSG